ncbi:iron-sulfur cluster repair di-iron protein [Halopiger djelfimassiliensis]|uniref:iron-sulfur cluster repair di-iron protein n=1 Tax=Halopiger djelfimassiliensis TaxID=1293047 RepID=UPI0006777AC4|nr:iron-sulfur cluster repair di-iron protein [Halopiger djelfimassiliensis]
MNATIDPERQLGQLVEDNPDFARVFESLDIDYCCGGTVSLATACADAGLEVADVCDRLEAARSEGDGRERGWESLTQLANLIVWEHHRYLRTELPELEALVEKVARVHGDAHPSLRKVETEFRDLAAELSTHIDDEEQTAFPIIKKLDTGVELTVAERETLWEEIDQLEADHDETAARLERLEELTDGYAVPDDACTSYRSMLDRLAELERNTHMHVHRENNVLFPKAESKLD